jgi:ABC-type antimicrobial peptide transport system permease subunit
MFKNYFITSWRNLIRDKSYSSFNILGLAVGMGVALLIGLWVQHQLSYDRWLPGSEQAFRVMFRTTNNGETGAGLAVPLPLEDVLKKDIPEIRYVARADWMVSHSLMAGEKKIYSAGAFAGEAFLRIFPFRLLRGNAAEVLKEPRSIVLTQATATALFGQEDPMNKVVRIDNQHNVKVTGVLADLPGNCSFQFKYIVPFSLYVQTQEWIRQNLHNWNMDPIQTFVGLQPGATMEQVDAKLKNIIEKYDPRDFQHLHAEVFLHPFRSWHLYSHFENGKQAGGFIDYVRMFSLIGLVVLVIACINFVNLSTARSQRRAREVGVRKAIGSLRGDILLQFLVEAFVITIAAFAIALLLVSLALPAFNSLTSSSIHIPWTSALFWTAMGAYVLFTSLLAGSRPAFHLSAMRPVKVLKGGLKEGRAAALPRKILVTAQFTASVALIISTVIIYRQIEYAKNRPKGFDAGRLVMTDGSTDLDHNYTALKRELLQSRLVTSVTRSTTSAVALPSWTGVNDWQGKYPGETLGVATVGITDDYFTTLGMQVIQGREFDKGMKEDTTEVILNEAAVKRLRFKQPLNQVILWNNQQKVRVIGVVKDALMESPYSSPEPTFFAYNTAWSSSVMYRLAPGVDAAAAIAKIGAIFNRWNPAYPFTYHFADQAFNAKFEQEVLVGTLAGIFAALAILISCLGLFGLAAYMAQQRTREIGIRKVLGATVGQVVVMISREFVLLVLVGCLIASPMAFYFMRNWLQGYDYRVSITADIFIYSTLAALLITFLTISFQSVRAARQNPVNSLRTD